MIGLLYSLLLTKFKKEHSAQYINNILYYKSKEIIVDERYCVVPTHKQLRTQIDLMAINHYTNKNRRVSLKQLEFAFGMTNIRELPYNPTHPLEAHQIDNLIDYLHVDLEATNKLYEHTKDAITLREDVSFKFKYDFLNMSESSLGESLLLLLYCRKTNTNKELISKLRTYRDVINFKDVVIDDLKYSYEGFTKLYNWLKNKL
jgi:hypothetical protein